jgi:hypothetical protein
MANKQVLSQDLKVPPGVVLTPGHLVDVPPETPGPDRLADRRVDHRGVPEDLGGAEHLSTYEYDRQPVAPVDKDALPRESVAEANAQASKK